MDRLHLDLLVFDQVLSQLRRLGWWMDEDVERLERALRRLRMAWEGTAALDFDARARSLLRRLEALVDEYHLLVQRAERERREWEDLDRAWAHFWRTRSFE